QNIDKWGALGNAAPAIVAVKDVPNDQGGAVRVSWNASYLDAYPGYAIGSYWLWRQVPASAAQAALRSGGARLLRAGETPVAGRGRVLRAGAQGVYWEFVASQLANGFPSYSLVAATLSDSTPVANPPTVFMVEARGSGHVAWDSAPDSGYSVDNLAPPAPAPFAASYAAGVTSLHWSPPSAPDLASYRLYRGASSDFLPVAGNLIGAPTETTFADSPGGFYYYKVSAVDVHGNEGPTSLAFPTAATSAPATAPPSLALLGAAPNPLRAQSAIRWTQPRAAAVRVTLRDLAGRRVRSLLDGSSPAGAHAVRWDARDDAGRAVPDGIYFLELEAEGRLLRTRVAVVR
ncbi:MAG TPA: FlgD immunoglobulin-like domain containing protein, partial [Candidatus Eisenbacteria bacterium]|nr:FlgD immunoglobulin-like domain containing protein [Candidatus Eisenbacteria bacterium]